MDDTLFHLLDNAINNTINVTDALSTIAKQCCGPIVFSSSFSFEDQVITHLILSHRIPIEIFTLDTGRLFSETYDLWMRTNKKYNTQIRSYYPNNQQLEEYVNKFGCNGFYESVSLRQKCCFIRKVEPLQRALDGKKVWVTGLRSEHSHERQKTKKLEWDERNKILKFHPLLDWSTTDVRNFIDQHQVPYNPLHDKGFASIGCAPCTRAIKQGEDFRAGRWWWENATHKECGLHR